MLSRLCTSLTRLSIASRPLQPPRLLQPSSNLLSRGFKYKLKSHAGTKKRFKALGQGGFKHWQVGSNHLKRKLRAKPRRMKGKAKYITDPTKRRLLRRLLPYKA